MSSHNIIALDVGEKRIGIAIANEVARFASPYKTIDAEGALETIKQIVISNHVSAVVVGLPRNMSGDETAQTESVRTFTAELEAKLDVPVTLQDESLTSVKAEDELRTRGKPYEKADIDALAACYILEDFLAEGARL